MPVTSRMRHTALLLTASAVVFCGCTTSPKTAPAPSTPAPSASPAPSHGGGLFPETVDIGVKSEQPGFSIWDDERHEYAGFEKDLAYFLGDGLGFQPDLTDVPSAEREDSLTGRHPTQHRVQLVIATYSITPDRLKQIDFAGPYFQTRQGLMVKAGDKRIKTRKDAAGKSICTVKGSTSAPEEGGASYENNPLDPKANIQTEKDYRTCVALLKNGSVDAVWTDLAILYGFTETDKDLQVLDGIQVGKPQLYGVGLPKHHEKQCRRVAEQLKEFLKTGWNNAFRSRFPHLIEAMGDEWETTYKPPVEDVKCSS